MATPSASAGAVTRKRSSRKASARPRFGRGSIGPLTFSSPRRNEEVESAITSLPAAYAESQSLTPWPTLHPAFVDRVQHLPPLLDVESGLRVTRAGLSLVQEGRFPNLTFDGRWDSSRVCHAEESLWAAYLVGLHAPGDMPTTTMRAQTLWNALDPLREIFDPLGYLLDEPNHGTPALLTFFAVTARPRIGYVKSLGFDCYFDCYAPSPWQPGLANFSQEDYDILTLPWRCRVGPLHPDDDNDVCADPLIELVARRLQRQTPALTREAARVAAALQ